MTRKMITTGLVAAAATLVPATAANASEYLTFSEAKRKTVQYLKENYYVSRGSTVGSCDKRSAIRWNCRVGFTAQSGDFCSGTVQVRESYAYYHFREVRRIRCS